MQFGCAVLCHELYCQCIMPVHLSIELMSYNTVHHRHCLNDLHECMSHFQARTSFQNQMAWAVVLTRT